MKRNILTLFIGSVLFLLFAAPALAQGPQGEGEGVYFGQNFTLEAERTHQGDLAVIGGNATFEANSTVDGDVFVMGGNLTSESSSTVDGSLAVFGGNATITGDIDGDLGVLGGNAVVEGTVRGDVFVLGGNVDVTETGDIEGDVEAFGGRVNRARSAVAEGDRAPVAPAAPTPPAAPGADNADNDDDDDDSRFDSNYEERHYNDYDGYYDGYYDRGPGFLGWTGMIIGDIFWNIALIVVLGLIAWLVAAFMPEQMMTVRGTLTASAPLSFGLGLLTSVVAAVFVPVAFLLVITICLAIIPIVGYLALGIATLFGWIVIGQILGERLLVASGRPQPGLIFSSIFGVAVLTLLTNLPVISLIDCIGFIGSLIGGLVAMLGLGAVLLTRFGTRPYPGGGAAASYSGGSGGPSPAGGGFGSYSPGARARWTEPAPEVSEEEAAASDEELRAKIKAALAEADEVAEARAKVEATRDAEPSAEETDAPEETEETSTDEGEEKPDAEDEPKK